VIYIDQKNTLQEIARLLIDLSWIDTTEEIQNVEIAGQGNMNVVLRITSSERSFILKQSRPFVQKYPQIEAPLERVETEFQFYQALQNEKINTCFPSLVHYSDAHYLVMMEDLGQSPDLTFTYNKRSIDESVIEKLIHTLSTIHQCKPPINFPKNMALRQLNHAHIFVLPFEEKNGFDLNGIQEGLQELSLRYKNDAKLKSIVGKIGDQYLSAGKTLLHGDYYPGSWLSNGTDVFIIDPEFSFVGYAEYDLGVMAAHIYMITHDHNILTKLNTWYGLKIDQKLCTKMIGIEVMRRLIGLAQLPLNRTLDEKKEMLAFAHKLIAE
jgi:5-methylthioribose kinase